MATTHRNRSEGISGAAKTLLVIACIGAINWGLIGFFNWNLVDAIFGNVVSRVIYVIVGIAGVASLFFLPKLTAKRHDRIAEPTTTTRSDLPSSTYGDRRVETRP